MEIARILRFYGLYGISEKRETRTLGKLIYRDVSIYVSWYYAGDYTSIRSIYSYRLLYM